MELRFRVKYGDEFQVEIDGDEDVESLAVVVMSLRPDLGEDLWMCHKGRVLKSDALVKDIGYQDKDFIVVGAKKPATAAPAAAALAPAATPAMAPAPAAPSANMVPEPPAEAIAQLCSMGFQRAQVVAALRAAFNHPDRAVDYLFNGIPSSAALSADGAAAMPSPTPMAQPPMPVQPPMPAVTPSPSAASAPAAVAPPAPGPAPVGGGGCPPSAPAAKPTTATQTGPPLATAIDDEAVSAALQRVAEEPHEAQEVFFKTGLKVLDNTLQNPDETKFRKLSRGNEALCSKLLDVAEGAGVALLEIAGFALADGLLSLPGRPDGRCTAVRECLQKAATAVWEKKARQDRDARIAEELEKDKSRVSRYGGEDGGGSGRTNIGRRGAPRGGG